MPFTPPVSIDEFSGSGTVFNGDLLISEVQYAIAVDHDYLDASGLTTTGVIPTRTIYTLSINAQSPAIQAGPHDLLTLRMENGKRLNFYWWGTPKVTNGIY